MSFAPLFLMSIRKMSGKVVKFTPVAVNQIMKNPKVKVDPKIIAIEKDAKKFRRTLKQARKTGASIDIDELKYMRRAVRRQLPVAEEVFATYKNDRAAVAWNILMNQQRELINDMKALDSGPRQLQHIMQRIITPMLQAIMQNYMVDCSELKKHCRKIKDKTRRNMLIKQINKSLEAQGQFFNTAQQGLDAKLSEYLIGKS